ncbi:MAG: cupin domain-containing protein [Magnetococcales bacterium]|nr:cupin domain-containing protein [Magnetococcales bacterium]
MSIIEIIEWSSEAEMRADMQQRGHTPARYTYPPGLTFPPHTHDEDKIAAVVSGQFRISIYGQTVVLGELQGVFVPRHAVHSAEVVGQTPVVSVDAVKYT